MLVFPAAHKLLSYVTPDALIVIGPGRYIIHGGHRCLIIVLITKTHKQVEQLVVI